MPLRYVDIQDSGIQPRSLQVADSILSKRQQRYDYSVAAREQALQEALSRGYVDPSAREQYIQRANQRFDEVSKKYRGDLSAGRDEILGAVTDIRTDPYIQANKAQLEALQLENQLAAKIGPEYSYMKSSVADTPLYDETTGQYRTRFQPQVYDLRNLAKLAGAEGQGISARNIGKWRSTGDGYQERMIGYDTPGAERFMQNEGQEYLNNILISQGLDANDPRARQIASEAMFTSLIGKPETRADRSLDMEIKRMQLAKSRSPRVSLDEPTMSTIGRKPVFMRTESEKDLFKPTITNVNDPTYEQKTLEQLNKSKESALSKIKELEKRIVFTRDTQKDPNVRKSTIANYSNQIDVLKKGIQNKDNAVANLKKQGVAPFEQETDTTYNIPDKYKEIHSLLKNTPGIGEKEAGEYLQNTMKLANELTQPYLYYEENAKKREDLIKNINAQAGVGQSKFYPVEFKEDEGYVKEEPWFGKNYKQYKDISGGITKVDFAPYTGTLIVTDKDNNQYELDRTSIGQAGNIAKIAEEATNFFKDPVTTSKKLDSNITNMRNIELKLGKNPNPNSKSLIPAVKLDYYDGSKWNTRVVPYPTFINHLGEQMFKQLTTKK